MFRRAGTTLSLGLGLLACAGIFAVPSTAAADQLSAEQLEGEAGYSAIEELSFETIFEASDGYSATLKLRAALHNSSQAPHDAVLSLALPFASSVEGVATVRDGTWTEGKATSWAAETERRDPGTVYVRQMDPEHRSDVPGAEVVVFGIDPDATVQVEVRVRIHPRLRGDHWEVDLPSRGLRDPVLAPNRRVLVQGLREGESFLVDGRPNGNAPVMLTRPEDMVTVAWPAHIRSEGALGGHFEVRPGPPGFDDGEFRLYLRLGRTEPPKPDHVVVLIDHSRSTDGSVSTDTLSMLQGLFAELPKKATFDAVAFHRHTAGLLDHLGEPPSVKNPKALQALRDALADAKRGQGTDIGGALAEAAQRARKHGARRPLIVMVTDGMFPARVAASDIREAFEAAAAPGRRRPDVLFVIDDPVLIRKGLSPKHPVAKAAGAIGARISLESLAQLGSDSGADLLAAPRVLGGLRVELPENAELQDDVPSGLVAGAFVMLRGRYVGKPPKAVRLRGHFGEQKVHRKIAASDLAARPQALVATTVGDLEVAAAEGYTQPPWYKRAQEADARRTITQAGRAGREVEGYLDERIFRYYLTTRVLPRARACYNRSLTRNTDQEGRVLLEMEVGKGEVMLAHTVEAKLEHQDPELVACMTEAAWSLDIPAGKLDDQIYRLRYPLSLIAPEEGKVTGRVERIPDRIMKVLLAH